MTVNRHKYFRWTRRTAWITFAYVVLVPGILGTAGYMTEVSGLRAQVAAWGRKGRNAEADNMSGQVGNAWQAKG